MKKIKKFKIFESTIDSDEEIQQTIKEILIPVQDSTRKDLNINIRIVNYLLIIILGSRLIYTTNDDKLTFNTKGDNMDEFLRLKYYLEINNYKFYKLNCDSTDSYIDSKSFDDLFNMNKINYIKLYFIKK